METERISFQSLVARTIVVHTVTYVAVGALAAVILGYGQLFALPELACYMRQIEDKWVMAGPLLQPIRGLIFACVFYALRGRLFGSSRGWLVMWLMLVGVGILSTFGPAPGSVEGLVYTRVPLRAQLTGLPEVITQAMLLACVLVWWVRHPERRWVSWVLGALFVVVVALLTLGLTMTQGQPN